MVTREVLLKADKISVVFERLADGKNTCNGKLLGRRQGGFVPSSARSGDRQQASGLGPGRQAGRDPVSISQAVSSFLSDSLVDAMGR